MKSKCLIILMAHGLTPAIALVLIRQTIEVHTDHFCSVTKPFSASRTLSLFFFLPGTPFLELSLAPPLPVQRSLLRDGFTLKLIF